MNNLTTNVTNLNWNILNNQTIRTPNQSWLIPIQTDPIYAVKSRFRRFLKGATSYFIQQGKFSQMTFWHYLDGPDELVNSSYFEFCFYKHYFRLYKKPFSPNWIVWTMKKPLKVEWVFQPNYLLCCRPQQSQHCNTYV